MIFHGLKLFMEKLNQMIYSNDNPRISNHPSMLSKRPQLQLLYEELGSMIRILSVEKGNDLHELEEVRNLKKRFKDVVEEAYDVVDLFLYVINFKNKRPPRISHAYKSSLELEDVMRSIKSIKEDFISIPDKMMESSPGIENQKTRSAAACRISNSRNSAGLNKVRDHEIVVGLDADINLVRDRLVEDTKKLDVVSIVGMGGLGKTTLATKVFNDPFVVYHFAIRGWVTVSQTYERTDLLNQILASIGIEIDPVERDNYSHPREMLHKRLMSQRYLVVIDDIWNTEAWDDLKVVFPDYNNGSRLLLTSRHKKVALYAKPHGFVHELKCLTVDESWELLCKKVFRGNDFPDWLNVPGMRIARNCRGLPLSVVVIAGVLAKESVTKDSWERISWYGGSLKFSSLQGHMETLASSLNHLPSHLRDCFLYLGGFPEDYRFQVKRLIWLWIAEGFIQEDENQSLEETATDYLMELVDRNLVVAQDRNFEGAIKTFSVHDVLRELCLEVATEERFYLKTQESGDPFTFELYEIPYKTRRVFTNNYMRVYITNTTRIRSLLCFDSYRYGMWDISKDFNSLRLLTVLDIKQWRLEYFPEEISLLVSLRYLAIWIELRDFQSTICDLCSLQILIIESTSRNLLMLPNTISNLVNLRHWRSPRAIIFPQLRLPLMNLQTISNVVLGDGPKSWVNYFPCVKKLSCLIFPDRKYDLKSLAFLEILKVRYMKSKSIPRYPKIRIRFPASLKKLALHGCHLPWSCMSKIQSLPNLEVLKLLNDAFVGPLWDAGEEPFRQLKLLRLEQADIKQWEASSINFPYLKQLFLMDCPLLEGIPLEMSYIPTLEHIRIRCCNSSVTESAYEIQEEQHAEGKYDLKIRSDNEPTFRYLMDWEIRGPISVMEFARLLLNSFNGIRDTISTSINRLARHQLETLGLPVNHLPPAYHHISRSRIWNDGRSKYRPIKPKILKEGGRIRLFQY